jgi:hypothetical protein
MMVFFKSRFRRLSVVVCRVSLPVLAICWAAGCQEEKKPTMPASEYAQPSSVPASAYVDEKQESVEAHLCLVDATEASGVNFRHFTGAYGKKYMPETIGSGVAMFDADGDRDLDLFFVNGDSWADAPADAPKPADTRPQLYLNDGSARFELADPVAWGLDFSLYGMGAAAGDYDADGDLDLYLTSVGDNKLLRNEGGRFADVTPEAGVAGGRWKDDQGREHPEWSASAVWLDYDNDGLLDLYVANYVQWAPETDVFTTLVDNKKSYATPTYYEGLSGRLYHNQGDGTFKDATEEAGVRNPDGKSMSVALADFNRDGWVDLVVTNDTQPNYLYLNQADGTFEEVGAIAGVAFDEGGRARAGMGVDVADTGNDGRLAVAIGNFSAEATSLYTMIDAETAPGEPPFFTDEAGSKKITGPTRPFLTFAAMFADFDADGWQDLVLGNGHIEPEIALKSSEITFEQTMLMLRNVRGEGFVNLGAAAGEIFQKPLVVRGLAVGDLNNDGDLDAAVAQNGADAKILLNESPGAGARSIRFDLRGSGKNARAIGAQIVLETAPADAKAQPLVQRRMVRGGSSFLSQSDLAPTFGVPAGHAIRSALISWPGGGQTTLKDLQPGASYVVRQEGETVERLAFRNNDAGMKAE